VTLTMTEQDDKLFDFLSPGEDLPHPSVGALNHEQEEYAKCVDGDSQPWGIDLG
jgi:hypothetical protein